MNITEWTRDTIDCYKIGCTCSKCKIIPKDIKKNCKLKKTVIKLVEKMGAPIENLLLEGEEIKIPVSTEEISILKLLPLENAKIADRLLFSQDELEKRLYGLFIKFKAKTKTELLAKVLFYEIIALGEVLKCVNLN